MIIFFFITLVLINIFGFILSNISGIQQATLKSNNYIFNNNTRITCRKLQESLLGGGIRSEIITTSTTISLDRGD